VASFPPLALLLSPAAMIDLHLHTTASDGTDSPAELVAACRAAGLTVAGVADHDTMSAVPEMARAARDAGIGFVPGVEITAAWQGRDVHILGYFLDHRLPELLAFLDAQRTDRIRRSRLVAERLDALGVPIDIEALILSSQGRPLSRPHIAQALIDRGHVSGRDEAFDRFLGDDAPAFVPRAGATPAEVVRIIAQAGGVSSLAHPGITGKDDLIGDLAASGLDALEAYHPDHTLEDTARYLALGRAFSLAVTGGSDYHGRDSHHAYGFGVVTLPPEAFSAFCRRAGHLDWGQTRTAGV
jgi:predicted metal-dependent phosphoesterase TrpH